MEARPGAGEVKVDFWGMGEERGTGASQLAEAIEDFVEHARLVQGRSEATVRAYRCDLATLGRCVDGFGSFTLRALRAWLAEGLSRGLARSTLARRTAAVRAFSTWAFHQGHLDSDVAARLAQADPGNAQVQAFADAVRRRTLRLGP